LYLFATDLALYCFIFSSGFNSLKIYLHPTGLHPDGKSVRIQVFFHYRCNLTIYNFFPRRGKDTRHPNFKRKDIIQIYYIPGLNNDIVKYFTYFKICPHKSFGIAIWGIPDAYIINNLSPKISFLRHKYCNLSQASPNPKIFNSRSSLLLKFVRGHNWVLVRNSIKNVTSR